MRIAVILDSSAVLRFTAATDIAVGELIGEVADDHAFVAVPVTALALARAADGSAERLSMLSMLTPGHPSVVVLPMNGDQGTAVGEYAERVNSDIGLAHAVLEAERHQAQLATDRGDLVRSIFGEMFGIVDI